MTYFLTILAIYIWPFGQLLTFSSPVLPFTIYYLDIIVFLISVFLVASKKRTEIFKDPITKPLVMFLGIATISLLINIQFQLIPSTLLSASYLLRLITYPSIFYAAKLVGFQKLKHHILISIGIFSVLSLLQYLLIPDMRFLKNLGFDDHYYRLIGPLFDPNYTGAIFAGVALYFIGNNAIIFSLPSILLLAPTVSRASYVAFIFGLFFNLFSRKKIKILTLILLFGIIVNFVPKPFGEGVNLLRTFSIYSRIDSWMDGLKLFMEKPLLGWGYNTLRGVNNIRYQIDNSFIFLLSTTGILGLLAFLALLKTIFETLKNYGVRLLIISVLVHSLFNNSLFYIWIMAMFWLLIGVDRKSFKECS